jgi:hypothetical protein
MPSPPTAGTWSPGGTPTSPGEWARPRAYADPPLSLAAGASSVITDCGAHIGRSALRVTRICRNEGVSFLVCLYAGLNLVSYFGDCHFGLVP